MPKRISQADGIKANERNVKMGKHQPEIIPYVCRCCGAKGLSRKVRDTCCVCVAAMDKLGAHLVGMSEPPPDSKLHMMFCEYRNEYIAAHGKEDGATVKPRLIMPTEPLNMSGDCKFCGKPTGSVFKDYCQYCIREGFDNVHRLTGRAGHIKARKKVIRDNLKI